MDSFWTKHADIVRVLISLILSYFLAVVYNVCLATRSIYVKHVANILFGLAICYFNFGTETIHSLLTCMVVWSSIYLLGTTRVMVVVNFIFCIGYLLFGYHQKLAQNESPEAANAITWTLPQCVLTLSLIALSFDVYDGKISLQIEPEDASVTTTSDSSANRRLQTNDDNDKKIPSLLLILSKVYFPPTFLIGPQVRFKDFQQFINLKQSFLGENWKLSLLRLSIGLVYYLIYQVGQLYFPLSFLSSNEFKTYGLFSKLFIVGLTAKITLCKYIGAWVVVEGACILWGVARDPQTGQADRCYNMSLLCYETTPTFGGLIESFNMSTNYFAMTYVYKRLRFLGSRVASQAITMFFLALWHGYASGYYHTFFMEVLIMKMEKDISTIVIKHRTRNQWLNRLLNQPSIRWCLYFLMRLHVFLMFGYAFLSFGVLYHQLWRPIYSQLHHVGHIIYGGWFVISVLLKI